MLARLAERRRWRVLAPASLLLALAVPATASAAAPLSAARGFTVVTAATATPTPSPTATPTPPPTSTPDPEPTPTVSSPDLRPTDDATPTSTPDPEPTPTVSSPDPRPADDDAAPAQESRGEVLAATDSHVKPAARLSGLTGCVKTAKSVQVTGTRIGSVVFSLDGKKLRSVKARNSRVAATKLTVANLKAGTHTLTAKVTFSDGTKAKTLKLRFSRCTTAKLAD